MTGSKYLKICLGLTLFSLATVAAINYWADPAGIYHYGESWDWIQSRPSIPNMIFVHKANELRHVQADVLFFGSSRVAEGLDPHNPVLPAPAYNAGLYGSQVYETWRYLQHAIAIHVPQTVVLGIDCGMFDSNNKTNPIFSDDQLRVQADGSPTPCLTYFFADSASTLFSLSTLQLSFRTLLEPKGSHMTFNAGYEADAPRILDHMDLARNVLDANQQWLSGGPGRYRSPDGRSPEMDAFEHIIALCADKHIHLIVFIQPLHAARIDCDTNDWGIYADWLKAVAVRMESNPSLKGELWDFMGYTSISTEPFPLPTDTYSRMRYYWEGSHYRKIVGDMVLQRIFAGTGPESFGRLVTTATVDQDLQRLMEEKRAWHEQGQVVPISDPQMQTSSAK